MKKRYTLEKLEERRLLVSDWQNPLSQFDVNNDGFVSPIDVLIGVNRLNRHEGDLGQHNQGDPFYDTNGDREHSPADILWVVNEINQPTPALTVDLIDDTGEGPGADSDRLTNNFGIRGAFSGGTVDSLWARWDTGDWFDVSIFLRNASFEISDDYLVEFLDIDYMDGDHKIEIEGRIDSKPNTASKRIAFKSDQAAPRSDTPGTITMAEPGVIVIPVNESVVEESLDVSAISVFDTTLLSVRVSPAQIQFVNDSAIRIDLPRDTLGGSYRVYFGETAFEDKAGNRALRQQINANYFDESRQTQLEFGQTINLQSHGELHEFVFELPEQDLLIWGGTNAPADVISRLLGPAGDTVAWPTNTFTELDAGQYVLRVFSPPGTSPVQFRYDLGSQLSYFDAGRVTGQRNGWETATILLRPGSDQIYFRNELEMRQSSLSAYSTFTRQTGISTNPWSENVAVQSDGEAVYVRIRARTPEEPYSYDFSIFPSTDSVEEYQLGSWIDSSEDSPGQTREFHFPVTAGAVYVLDQDTSVARYYENFELLYPARDRSENFTQLYQTSFPGTAIINTDKQAPDSEYRFRVRDVTGSEQLQMGTHPVPAPFESEVFQHKVAAVDYLRFDSEHAISIYKDTDFGLERLDRSEFDDELDAGTYYIIVNRTEGVTSDTWTVEKPTIPNPGRPIIEPLPGDRDEVSTEVLRENFHPRRTHYFTFEAEANDVYVLNGLGGNYLNYVDLINSNGSSVPSTTISGSQKVWRVEQPDTYTLRVKPNTDKLHFQILRLHAAPTLADDQGATGTLSGRRADVYSVPSTTQDLVAIADQSPNGIYWGFLDEDGEELFQISHLPHDISTEFAPRNARWLWVHSSKFSNDSQYQLRLRAPNVETEFISSPFDHSFTGNLNKRGDKKVFEFELSAADTLEFASHNFASEQVDIAFNRTYVDSADSMRQPIYRTRKYELQIVSNVDHQIDLQFSLRRAEPAPEYLIDGEFIGFDRVQSGLIPQEGFDYKFTIEEGCYFIFDWRLEDTDDVTWGLVSPSGNILSTGLPTDRSNTWRATESGQYTLALRNNTGVSNSPFQFAMLSPNTAMQIGLNELHDAPPLAPRSWRLYRLRLDRPTEIVVEAILRSQANIATVPLDELRNIDGYGEFSSTNTGKSKEGDLIIWQFNPTEEEVDLDFTVRDLQLIPYIQLDSPFTYAVQSGTQNTYRFHAPEPMSLFFESTDPRATDLLVGDNSEQTGRIDVLGPSDYYLRVSTYGDVPNRTNFVGSFNRRKVESFPLELNQVTSGEIDRTNDWHEYHFPVEAGSRLWFAEFDKSTPTIWVSPSGIKYLAEGILPTYESGMYRLRFRDEDYRFKVLDMESIDVIKSGSVQGQIATDDPIALLRIEGKPRQNFSGGWTIGNGLVRGHDQSGNDLHQVNSFYVIPDDGVAFLSFIRKQESDSTEYVGAIELRDELELPYTIGDRLTFRVAKGQLRTLTFALSHGDYYRAEVTGTYSWFSSNLQVSTFREYNKSNGPVFDSTYQFVASNEVSTNEATLRIASLNQALPIVPGSQTAIKAGRYYRLEIEEPGAFAVDLLDSSGQRLNITPQIEIPGAKYHESYLQSQSNAGDRPRYTFDPRKYWFRIPDVDNPPTDWTVEVVPLRLNESTLSTDEQVKIDLAEDGKDESLFAVNISPLSRVLPDFSFSKGVNVEYHWQDNQPWQDDQRWSQISDFHLPHTAASHETLLVRVTGVGTAAFSLVDLNKAAELPENTTVLRTLTPSSRMVAYRISGNIGKRIQVRPSASVAGVRMQIVSSAAALDDPVLLNAVFSESPFNAPVQVSRTNHQPLTLLIFFDGLTEETEIEFDTLVLNYA